MAQILIFAFFLYFAYFFDFDNQCMADNASDVPLLEDSNIHGIDVGSRFKMGIRFGFWLSFVNFARATLAQVAFVTKKWQLLLISYFVFALSLAAMIILFILMSIWRWSHSGRVCAGDYLTDKDAMTEEQLDQYLITEGNFIFWVLVLSYLKFSVEIALVIIYLCVITYRAGGENVIKETQQVFSAAVDDQVAEAQLQRQQSIIKSKKNSA